MLQIKEAIVVEGRYDKHTIAQIVDTLVIETGGFQLFHNEEKKQFLKLVASKRGLVVLTDSDGAGFIIRNQIKSLIEPRLLKHAYIPDIYGKERRKTKAGKEGKLGVEGIPADTLLDVLKRANVTVLHDETPTPQMGTITKHDFYVLGLTGRENSCVRRQKLLKALELPEHLSANALLDVLNTCYSRQAVEEAISGLELQG